MNRIHVGHKPVVAENDVYWVVDVGNVVSVDVWIDSVVDESVEPVVEESSGWVVIFMSEE